jgi:hypothetical protein
MAYTNQPGEYQCCQVNSVLNRLQIFATTSLGACHVLYSPTASVHGALLPLSKMPRQNRARDDVYVNPNLPPVIMTPHALPMFQDEDYRQTKRQKEKKSETRKPEEPLKGAGKGGRVGASATQHLVQHMFKNTMRDEDVSDRVLKSGIKGRADTTFVAKRSIAQICRQGRKRPDLHER